MKRIATALTLVLIFPALALASGYHYKSLSSSYNDSEKYELGAMLDMPDLIKFNDKISVGVEGFKDTFHTNFKEGWGAYGKVTIKWSLLDFSKK